jgi:hypothetical protein
LRSGQHPWQVCYQQVDQRVRSGRVDKGNPQVMWVQRTQR